MAKVNLDALIPREDFEVEENINPGKKKETISIEDIKADSFFFSNIRKPDFQRETNEWDSKKICRKYRYAQKSYKHISKFFQEIVIAFKAGKTIDETINEIISIKNFNYLTIQRIIEPTDSSAKDFNTGKKSAIYIKEALQNAPRCNICNGFIHRNSISIDHKKRKEDGGLATLDNGQIAHPYCNTGYKN